MVEEKLKGKNESNVKKEVVETEKSKVNGEKKAGEDKISKKEEKKEIIKKDRAIVYGKDLPVSTKHAIAICKFIKGKKPEQAMNELNEVIKFKKAIPMKGEIPHRKGAIASGRYPVKASQVFIKLLKNLIGNSNVNGLEEPVIVIAKPDRASRPYRRFGNRRFKRTNVLLEAREFKQIPKQEEKETKKEIKQEK